MAAQRPGTSEIPSGSHAFPMTEIPNNQAAGLPAAATARKSTEVASGYQVPNKQAASLGMAPPPPRGGSNVASTSGTKKRGRPRKYGSDGTVPAAKRSYSPRVPTSSLAPSEHNQDKTPTSEPIGRNWSSVITQCNSFMPHMITISPDEDVAWKIAEAAQQRRRGIVIMSANGMLKKVAVIDPAHDDGVVRHEGQFKIIQMSGTFMIHDKEGTRRGAMTVHLADFDGRVLLGAVGGALIAATPVQVFIGSFTAGPQKITPKAEKPDQEPNVEEPGAEPNVKTPEPEPNVETPRPEPNVETLGLEPNIGTPMPEPNVGPNVEMPRPEPNAGVAPFEDNQLFYPPNPNFGYSLPSQGEDSGQWWNNPFDSLDDLNVSDFQ
ncbi:AT-hook motif nuclear-localized protein 2-like [Pyrus x bretschneideri]|uniref:AT-hook motif nuclear-localized protein 2-like n=1 Tax=Pyrus x bretschneideri TaxID=225117 RepID=UPI0020309B36|nr:AT-hook motif nuclear-localized protein 2-like [Pyrus x bretschneideri]